LQSSTLAVQISKSDQLLPAQYSILFIG